jgi:hypothetical protein
MVPDLGMIDVAIEVASLQLSTPEDSHLTLEPVRNREALDPLEFMADRHPPADRSRHQQDIKPLGVFRLIFTKQGFHVLVLLALLKRHNLSMSAYLLSQIRYFLQIRLAN